MDGNHAAPERPGSPRLELGEFEEHLRSKRERRAQHRAHELDLSVQLVRIAAETEARVRGGQH